LTIQSTASEPAHQDTVSFIDLLDKHTTAQELTPAIEGQGAFHRLLQALHHHDEIHTRQSAFSEERQLGRTRAWLAKGRHRPVPEEFPTVS
jgi:hypothetical protein